MHASTSAATYAGSSFAWWQPLVVLAVVTAALSYVTGVAAARLLGSRLASFVSLTEVVASVLWAWLLLDELPRPVQIAGGLLILAGVVGVKLGERTVRPGNPSTPDRWPSATSAPYPRVCCAWMWSWIQFADLGPAPATLTFDAWATARVAGLLRFAYLVIGSQHAAEDAVQEALTSACAKWARVSRTRDPGRLRAADDRQRARLGLAADPARVAGAEVRDAAYADPAAATDTADAVWRVCQALPRQQRAAVVLRFYEDLEYAEIAAVLDLAEPTVRSHVHRALAALRVELTAQEDER